MSTPTTPLPVLEEVIPHHSCAVSSDREHGPRDGGEIWEGMRRIETRVLNQQAAKGLVSLIEYDGKLYCPCDAGGEIGRVCEPAKPPDHLVQEAEQASTTSDYTTPSSRQLGDWAEKMTSEFGGLEADGASFGESGFLAVGVA